MTKGKRAEVELTADGELGAALASLRDAAWRLSVFAFKHDERFFDVDLTEREARDLGACVAVAEVMSAQVDAIGTQVRRLRKRAREM